MFFQTSRKHFWQPSRKFFRDKSDRKIQNVLSLIMFLWIREMKFWQHQPKIVANFFLRPALILCYFSQSRNFSSLFINFPLEFFSVVVIRNTRVQDKKSPGSNRKTARLFWTSFAILSNYTRKNPFFTTETFGFGFSIFSAKNQIWSCSSTIVYSGLSLKFLPKILKIEEKNYENLLITNSNKNMK